jgi:hypothetical protein
VSNVDNHPDQGGGDILKPVQENLVDESIKVINISDSDILKPVQENLVNNVSSVSSINENLSVNTVSRLHEILNLKEVNELTCEDLLIIARTDENSFYNLDLNQVDIEVLKDFLYIDKLPNSIFD